MPSKKSVKTRASGTMTEAGFRAFVISALRSKSMHWKPIGEVKKKARVSRGLYRCNDCGKLFKKVVIDHICPVVDYCGFTNFDDYVNRLYCEEENLQALCENCHKKKTETEKQIRKNYGKKELRTSVQRKQK